MSNTDLKKETIRKGDTFTGVSYHSEAKEIHVEKGFVTEDMEIHMRNDEINYFISIVNSNQLLIEKNRTNFDENKRIIVVEYIKSIYNTKIYIEKFRQNEYKKKNS